MKKLLLIISIVLLFISCTPDEAQETICNCQGRWFIPRSADREILNIELPPDSIGLPTIILLTKYNCVTLEALEISYPHEQAIFLGCIE